jgi:hypothetical protein
MARDDFSKRNRYGRGGRGGREQNQYSQSRYDEGGQSRGRNDWTREQGYGGPPSGTPNWQHDYSYGGSRREFENESDWQNQGNRGWQEQQGYGREGQNRSYGRDWSREGHNQGWSNQSGPSQGQGQNEPRRGWSNQEQWSGQRFYGGANRGEYRGEFGEQYRPTTWPEQRGSFGEREYGQYQGGYGERGPSGYGESARGWAENPEMGMGSGRNLQYYPEGGYGGSGYGGAYPVGGQPSHYPGFMGTGAYWESHRPQGQQYGNQGFAGRGPKGYKRADDRIHEEICERLTRHPGIDASEIDIKVKNGEVTMSGRVHDRRFKRMAEDEVEMISGVKDVHNEIKVDREAPGFSREWEQGIDNGRTTHDEEEASRKGRDRTGANR